MPATLPCAPLLPGNPLEPAPGAAFELFEIYFSHLRFTP